MNPLSIKYRNKQREKLKKYIEEWTEKEQRQEIMDAFDVWKCEAGQFVTHMDAFRAGFEAAMKTKNSPDIKPGEWEHPHEQYMRDNPKT